LEKVGAFWKTTVAFNFDKKWERFGSGAIWGRFDIYMYSFYQGRIYTSLIL
jgi:hypothetical protein